MTSRVRLRLSGRHHQHLQRALYPGDGAEAVAFALCGRLSTEACEVFCVHEVHPAPNPEYTERAPDRVAWRTDWLAPLLVRAADHGWGLVKLHSHPTGHPSFSALDDEADRDLFPSIHGWTQDVPVHGSAVMLPDGELFGRGVLDDGSFVPMDRVVVAGDLVNIWDVSAAASTRPKWAERNAQVLGASTVALLSRLRIGVVGCSGTGSFVVELLTRLGVGELVLVDPDVIDDVNLNRIIWAYRRHLGMLKVNVAAEHVTEVGLGTNVVPVPYDLASVVAVRELAACDVLFGCMDSHDGRRLLNRLANFYVLPYFDCGVRIDADGAGGVDHISGAVHYLQPGGSSLLSRGVVDNDRATAEARRRADPQGYEQIRDEGYLRGLPAGQAAVSSINGMFASMAVNELLARLHGFRSDNTEYAEQRFAVHDPYYDHGHEGAACKVLSRHVGRGNVKPLLDMPCLSEKPATA